MVVMTCFLPPKRRWLFNILTCKENLLQFIVFTYLLYSILNDQLVISVRTTKINGLPYFLWCTLVWAKPGVVCLQICLCQLFGSCLNVPNCSPEMFLLNSIKKTSKDFTCQIFEDIVQNRTCEDYYHWLTLR